MDRRKLISRIWAVAREAGMDKQEVHEAVFAETGKESIRDCTDHQLQNAAKHMKYLACRQEASRGRATAKQKNFIRDLEYQLGWGNEPERLRGFLKKYYQMEYVDWLSVKQASSLIESLKKLLEKQKQKESSILK